MYLSQNINYIKYFFEDSIRDTVKQILRHITKYRALNKFATKISLKIVSANLDNSGNQMFEIDITELKCGDDNDANFVWLELNAPGTIDRVTTINGLVKLLKIAKKYKHHTKELIFTGHSKSPK